MLEVFSAQWAAAWRLSINESRGYRRSGARWTNTVAFVMTGGAVAGETGERAILLDLAGGQCLEARAATAQDLAGAAFVIASDPDTWRRVLTGKLDMVMAIMQKKFSLRRGTMAELLPHAAAAHDLLAAARTLDSRFPPPAHPGNRQ